MANKKDLKEKYRKLLHRAPLIFTNTNTHRTQFIIFTGQRMGELQSLTHLQIQNHLLPAFEEKSKIGIYKRLKKGTFKQKFVT